MSSSASLRSAVVLTVWSAMMGFLFCFDFVPIKARCYYLKCGNSIFYVGLVFVKVTPDVPWFSGSNRGCGSGGHSDVVKEFDSDKCDYFHQIDCCIIGDLFYLLECQIFDLFIEVWSSVEAFLFFVDNLTSGGLFNECPYNVGEGLFNLKVNLDFYFDIIVFCFRTGLFKYNLGRVSFGVCGGCCGCSRVVLDHVGQSGGEGWLAYCFQ